MFSEIMYLDDRSELQKLTILKAISSHRLILRILQVDREVQRQFRSSWIESSIGATHGDFILVGCTLISAGQNKNYCPLHCNVKMTNKNY